jgi:hypothetical protein
MALKIDKPLSGGNDELVVYVAHDLAAAKKAREALLQAGCLVSVPEAALVALFEQGAATVPIKVPARELSKALDAIEAAFPPPEAVVLPGAAPAPAIAPGWSAVPAAPAKPSLVTSDPDDDPKWNDDRSTFGAPLKPPSPEVEQAADEKALEKETAQAAMLAGASLLLLGPGLPFAMYAVANSLSCYRRSVLVKNAELQARVRRRALIGISLGIASSVGSLAVAAAFLASRAGR